MGVTGAPGVGKSSLVDSLVAAARADGERVAVVAVDPSSPSTGGAILGDRVRMQRHATDPGVFVRSMASRGRQGGLAPATAGAVRVLDATGWPLVLVETVGAGQVELDVARAADTTVVVVAPGAGDAVQAAKAGLYEVADLFVVNKADRPGADEVVNDLEQSLDLAPAGDRAGWRPPVLRTVAASGGGIDGLRQALARHRGHLAVEGRLAERRAGRLRDEVVQRVRDAAAHAAVESCRGPGFEGLMADVISGRVDPLAAAGTWFRSDPAGPRSDRSPAGP